jgi:hypothetical protein
MNVVGFSDPDISIDAPLLKFIQEIESMRPGRLITIVMCGRLLRCKGKWRMRRSGALMCPAYWYGA